MADDILIVEGINSRGYGIIPKAVMQDQRLSIYAKVIYAYFCSYAGAGNQVFPKRKKIIADLGMGKDAYHRYLKQLKELGYVKTEQKRINGKLSHNIFTLSEVIPCPESPYTVKPDTNIINKRSFKINSNNKINRESESAREENGNNSQNEEAIRAELVREFGEALTAEYVLKAENRNYEGLMALRKAKEWLMADKREGKLKKPVEKRSPSYDIEEYERFAMSFPISCQLGGDHEEIRKTRDESPTIYEKEEKS